MNCRWCKDTGVYVGAGLNEPEPCPECSSIDAIKKRCGALVDWRGPSPKSSVATPASLIDSIKAEFLAACEQQRAPLRRLIANFGIGGPEVNEVQMYVNKALADIVSEEQKKASP